MTLLHITLLCLLTTSLQNVVFGNAYESEEKSPPSASQKLTFGDVFTFSKYYNQSMDYESSYYWLIALCILTISSDIIEKLFSYMNREDSSDNVGMLPSPDFLRSCQSHIKVQTVAGIFQVPFWEDATARDVICLLKQKTKVAGLLQYAGRAFNDADMLVSHGVRSSSMLYLLPPLRGGMPGSSNDEVARALEEMRMHYEGVLQQKEAEKEAAVRAKEAEKEAAVRAERAEKEAAVRAEREQKEAAVQQKEAEKEAAVRAEKEKVANEMKVERLERKLLSYYKACKIITFEPGELGFEIEGGQVVNIVKGGQGERLGVQAGWRGLEIMDQAFTMESLRKFANGLEAYHITFSKQAASGKLTWSTSRSFASEFRKMCFKDLALVAKEKGISGDAISTCFATSNPQLALLRLLEKIMVPVGPAQLPELKEKPEVAKDAEKEAEKSTEKETEKSSESDTKKDAELFTQHAIKAVPLISLETRVLGTWIYGEQVITVTPSEVIGLYEESVKYRVAEPDQILLEFSFESVMGTIENATVTWWGDQSVWVRKPMDLLYGFSAIPEDVEEEMAENAPEDSKISTKDSVKAKAEPFSEFSKDPMDGNKPRLFRRHRYTIQSTAPQDCLSLEDFDPRFYPATRGPLVSVDSWPTIWQPLTMRQPLNRGLLYDSEMGFEELQFGTHVACTSTSLSLRFRTSEENFVSSPLQQELCLRQDLEGLFTYELVKKAIMVGVPEEDIINMFRASESTPHLREVIIELILPLEARRKDEEDKAAMKASLETSPRTSEAGPLASEVMPETGEIVPESSEVVLGALEDAGLDAAEKVHADRLVRDAVASAMAGISDNMSDEGDVASVLNAFKAKVDSYVSIALSELQGRAQQKVSLPIDAASSSHLASPFAMVEATPEEQVD